MLLEGDNKTILNAIITLLSDSDPLFLVRTGLENRKKKEKKTEIENTMVMKEILPHNEGTISKNHLHHLRNFVELCRC